LSMDDACAAGVAGSEECELSLRQLRGQRRAGSDQPLDLNEQAPQFNYNWNFGCSGSPSQEKPDTDGAQFNMNWNFCFDDKTRDEAAETAKASGGPQAAAAPGFDMGAFMKKTPGDCKAFGCKRSFDFQTIMNECQCFPGCNASFLGNICCPDFEDQCKDAPTPPPSSSTPSDTPAEVVDLPRYTEYANAQCSSRHGAVELKTMDASLGQCSRACKRDDSCEGFSHSGDGQCKLLSGINIPVCATSNGVWSTYVKNSGQKPPKCSAYMEKTGCGWTKKWNCPGQKAGTVGHAGQDGSQGYNCCCELGLYKSRPAIPTGTKLRIINKYSNRALFAKKGSNWEDGVGAGTPPEKVTEDGYWTLIPQRNNLYRIVNQYSKRALYAKSGASWEQGWGAGSPPNSVTSDGLWRIVHDDTGGFRIINKKSRRALYAKAGGAGEMSWSGGVGAGSARKVTKDGVWTLEFVK